MTECLCARLEDRGVLAVSGADARPFLQGMITNDLRRVSRGRAIHSAFLNAQGRYLHDFFVAEAGDGTLLLDCEAERAEDLARRLSMYRLRSKVGIEPVSAQWAVAALFGGPLPAIPGLAEDRGAAAPFAGGVAFVDSRRAEAGARLILPRAGADAALAGLGRGAAGDGDYDRHRLRLGLPDGSRDLDVERAILVETGFEELDGIGWDKGCYLGQELTTNSRRLVIRKRLMPVTIEGPVPPRGTELRAADGRKAGGMRSANGGLGLAMVRVEALDDDDTAVLEAGDSRLRVHRPAWMVIRRGEG